MTAQQALPFRTAPRFAAAELLPNPAQDDARAWLARVADWPLSRLVLWGAAGSGKSHLVHAWAETNGATVLDAAPAVWPGTPLAIDSLDHIPSETALFHLINAAAEARRPLLLTATLPPARLMLHLPDLASRLRATTAVRVAAPADAFLSVLLARLLADRQLLVSAGLQTWLLTRLPRNPAALRSAVQRLDTAGLEAGRAITRALAAAALGLDDNTARTPEPASLAPPALG